MGIGGMLNNQGGAPSMADQQHPGQAQVHPAFVMDRPNSPHGSEHSRYSGPMNTSYPSPTAMGAQLAQVPSANMGPSLPSLPPNMGHNTPPPGMSPGPGLPGAGMPGPGQSQPPAPKAYPCSTCGKGFARRSDLARHGMLLLLLSCRSPANLLAERIHSGVRPHVCDFENCGKQFIQRSALTVHQRVHTGEKPHQCERCGKVCLSWHPT